MDLPSNCHFMDYNKGLFHSNSRENIVLLTYSMVALSQCRSVALVFTPHLFGLVKLDPDAFCFNLCESCPSNSGADQTQLHHARPAAGILIIDI